MQSTETAPVKDPAGGLNQQEDAELVQMALRNDSAAWETLIRQHQEPVFRMAYLILGDPADAEDIAQETFTRAYLALVRFDRERSLRPWLLSIAANLARNRRRSIGRYWSALQRVHQANPEPFHAGPDRTAAADARRLREAVGRLRPQAQDIVYLRYFLELTEAETAEALDIPPGTAKSRLHRALTQLRVIIDNDFPDLRDAFG